MQEDTQNRLEMALSIAPPWPAQKHTQKFMFPYEPDELIKERETVAQIMALREKVERPVDCKGFPTKTGYPLSFQDAFIKDHYDRVWLMLAIENYRDWRTIAVADNLNSFPAGPSGTAELKKKRQADWCASMNVAYGLTQKYLQESSDNLVKLQALCSKLKPETLALVRRCSSYEELDRSMLMMREV